jgi:hypothetical protein
VLTKRRFAAFNPHAYGGGYLVETFLLRGTRARESRMGVLSNRVLTHALQTGLFADFIFI